jgi:hypothetical protein
MAGWIQSGKLKTREDTVDGLDAFPKAFDRRFTGANNGNLVLKVAPSVGTTRQRALAHARSRRASAG